MRHTLLAALGLGVIYALTLASADPVDFVTGAVLGGLLVAVLDRRLHGGPEGGLGGLGSRLVWFPVFAGAVVADVAVGTWDVALRVLHLRGLEHPGIVRVPIGERSERGVAVSALATTLSPGAILVDVDWERGDILVHVIDASDPTAVCARHERFYERYQRRVFP